LAQQAQTVEADKNGAADFHAMPGAKILDWQSRQTLVFGMG